MNLVVLALAVSSVSTALSAPIQNRCGNLFVESNGRAFLRSGIFRVPRVDSDLFRRFGFTKTPSTPSEDAYSEDTAPAKDRISDYHRLAYISLAAASMLAAGVGLTDYLVHNKNKTRRTFEAFEGSVNAELVGRALGDHDLDK